MKKIMSFIITGMFLLSLSGCSGYTPKMNRTGVNYGTNGYNGANNGGRNFATGTGTNYGTNYATRTGTVTGLTTNQGILMSTKSAITIHKPLKAVAKKLKKKHVGKPATIVKTTKTIKKSKDGKTTTITTTTTTTKK